MGISVSSSGYFTFGVPIYFSFLPTHIYTQTNSKKKYDKGTGDCNSGILQKSFIGCEDDDDDDIIIKKKTNYIHSAVFEMKQKAAT